jgi:hypothetical protein
MRRCVASVICLATLAASLATACLKSDDEIEIVDSSLGATTPTRSPTPKATVTATPGYAETFLSNLGSLLELAAAARADLAAKGIAGIADTRATGATTATVLAKLVDNSIAWLETKRLIKGTASNRVSLGAAVLYAGYLAVDVASKVDGEARREERLRSVAARLGFAFETLALGSSPLLTEYAPFAVNCVGTVFDDLKREGIAATTLRARASIMLGELAGAIDDLDALPGAGAYVLDYCSTAGVLAAELAGTTQATRDAFVADFSRETVAALRAAYGSSVPTEVDACLDEMTESAAAP